MSDILNWTRSVLTTTATRWTSLIDSLPDELLLNRPAANEWSAMECLQHLIDTERWVFPTRVQAFLAGDDFPAFDPDSQGSKLDPARPLAEYAGEFCEMREASLKALDEVAEADLDRRAQHPELGTVTLGEMLHEWAGHDLNHTVQAEQALMQPFIRESGPWRPSFLDHDIDKRAASDS